MIFKQLFDEIETKLKTITEIKNIEWYLDQDKVKGGISITPMVLIQFKPSKPVQLTKKSQSITVEFEVKIYTSYSKSYHKFTAESSHFNIEQSIFEKLVKYEQIDLVPAEKEDGLIFSSQTYELKLVCALPLPAPAQTIPSQNITPVIDTT